MHSGDCTPDPSAAAEDLLFEPVGNEGSVAGVDVLVVAVHFLALVVHWCGECDGDVSICLNYNTISIDFGFLGRIV